LALVGVLLVRAGFAVRRATVRGDACRVVDEWTLTSATGERDGVGLAGGDGSGEGSEVARGAATAAGGAATHELGPGRP
jgi:hypothetical protein